MGCARLIFMYSREINLWAVRSMIACWVIMLANWGFAWYSDWVIALVCMLGNFYFLLSLWFFWNLYPSKDS